MLLNQRHQLLIDVTEHQRADLVTRLKEGLSAHQPDRVRTIAEVGEELVQFGLDRTLHTRQQEGQNCWEAELAVAGEILWLETGGFQ
jgi:hypothetical protein